MTMTLISTVTVGVGGAASISFASIPQTATDLLLVISGRTTSQVSATDFIVTPNSATSSLSSRYLRGTGSTVSAGTYASVIGSGGNVIPGALSNADGWGNASVYICNYSNTSIAKAFSFDAVGEDNATGSHQVIVAGRWDSTSAITSIVLTTSGNWQQNTTASLYTIITGSGGATVS